MKCYRIFQDGWRRAFIKEGRKWIHLWTYDRNTDKFSTKDWANLAYKEIDFNAQYMIDFLRRLPDLSNFEKEILDCLIKLLPSKPELTTSPSSPLLLPSEKSDGIPAPLPSKPRRKRRFISTS